MARRDSRWRGIVVVVGLVGLAVVLLVVGVALQRNDLQTAANVAQLVSVVLVIVPLVVGLVVWWRRSANGGSAPTTANIDQAKDVLARLVTEQWRTEARLRSLADPDPMPVRWRLTNHKVMDHSPSIAAGPVLVAGFSNQIVELTQQFRALRRRRLVILGGPGTGKTTLAVQLVLQLLASLKGAEPVPVLMSVASWDTHEFPLLHEWLAMRLRQDYPALRALQLGEDAPDMLARGQILPVLDGLDELPKAAQARVITALNRSLDDADQLILTSRTTEFAEAVWGAGSVLTSAAVIEPEPLNPAAVADYLAACLPPAPARDWEKILTGLRTSAQSSRPPLPVAEIVSTPLGLWLLRTVYCAPGANPAHLLGSGRFSDAATLRAHLFDRLIPTLIAARPPSTDSAEPFRPHRAWNPVEVRCWLGYLACYLRQIPTNDGQRGTLDFAWWHLARHTLRPRTLPLLVGLVGGLVIGLGNGLVAGLGNSLIGGLANEFVVALPILGLVAGLGAWLMLGLVGGLAARSWSKETPGFADFHVAERWLLLIRLITRYGLGAGLVVGLWNGLGGLIFGLGARVGLIPGFVGGLGLGAVAGLGLGVIAWAETPTPEGRASTPMTSWRADRTLNFSKASRAVSDLRAGS